MRELKKEEVGVGITVKVLEESGEEISGAVTALYRDYGSDHPLDDFGFDIDGTYIFGDHQWETDKVYLVKENPKHIKNNKLKVVVFNAPARSGKDLAADYMVSVVENGYKRQFKDKLIELTANFLNISVEDFLEGYDKKTTEVNPYGFFIGDTPEWYKDVPLYYVKSPDKDTYIYSKRQALIHVSENVIKPIFGEASFGDALVKSLPEEGIVFIPDSGFMEELIPVIDHVGAGNILVIKIEREGCTFEGDSRDYLDTNDLPCNVSWITNNGTVEEFLQEVEYMVKNVFGEDL